MYSIPKIYFCCAASNIPYGGVKVLYKHVDILNKYGFDAFIMHDKPGFRCTWFENTTPIVYLGDTKIYSKDYLVIPEEIFKKVNSEFRGIKKVVFNQGCYSTFACGYSLDKQDLVTPYYDEDLIAALVISEDSRQYLSYVFPGLEVIRIHNAIDPNIFSFQDHKKSIISFMTRKNANDILQVINILKFRHALADYEIVPIEGKTEKEVAQIMKDTLIFLSFGYQEGFFLPAAEAMACGCVVIGYHGMGGREFFKPEFSFPITNGDIISFAQTVEKVIDINKYNRNILKDKGKLAAEYIAKNYSIEQQEEDVVKFWGRIVKSFSHLEQNEDYLDQS